MTTEEQKLNAELIRLQRDYDDLYLELEHTKKLLRIARMTHADIHAVYSKDTEPVQLEFRF